MDSEEALSLAAAVVEAQYQPVATSHPDEWTDRYIGVSTLVKKTAVEYATRIAAKQRDEADEEGRYYAFRGNALGDAALAEVPSREVRIELPLADGWRLIGHADAAIAYGNRVVCFEHKSHSNPTRTKLDMAFRQGAAYLALMREAGKAGEVQFPIATFCRDKAVVPFVWKSDYEAAGVVVAVAPYNPPATIQKVATSAADLDEILAFIIAKAEAVRHSGSSGDMAAAQHWDDAHPTEFLVPFSDIQDGLPEMEELGRQIADVKLKLRPAGLSDDEADDLEDELKRLRSLANLTMEKAELRSGVFAGVRFTRVVVRDKLVPAQPETIKSGFSFVKASVVR